MSSITQRVPNLYRGISQQPDSRKFPGQVKDAVNVFPDYALGMLKRPGGKYISDLKGASTSGRWFSILRDAVEKYVLQYDNNIFRVWSLIDGSPRKVDMGTNTGVPGSCNYTNYHTDVLAYNTAVALTKTRLAELKIAQKNYADVLAGQVTTASQLFTLDYTYAGTKVDEYMKSGILLDAFGKYRVKNNNTVVSYATSLPANYALGAERTDSHPLLASENYRVFEAILTTAATHTSTQLATSQTALTTAETNLANAKTAEATAETNLDAEVTACNVSSLPSNAYLNGATSDDIEFLTLNDFTFVLNKKKTVAMKSTTTAALPHQAFVVINVVAYNVDYKVILDSTTFTHSTPTEIAGGTNDANTIASALATAINANANFTAQQVGPGIYISSTSAFSIETRGGSQQDGIYSFQNSLPTISRLPIQAKNGYVLKIVNTTEIEMDDQWVKFETSNGQNIGAGAWVETVAPGLQYQLDELTLPHQLVRQADGSFAFSAVNWTERLVGDDNTNPLPSFIGNTIRSMFFYRNRFGFLSNDAVILSKAGDFFNFFVTSARTSTADDPIDISASSTRPVFLNYVQPSAVGLVLFGENDQFIMTTDSDILSPRSAKVNKLSSFEASPDAQPVSVGTSISFLSKTPLYTHLFELLEISRDQPPVPRDSTQTLAEFIPQSIDSLIASPGLSMVSLATTGSSDVYQYRFLQNGNERLIETWYRWKLTGKLLDQFFDNSTYYAVVHDDTRVYVMSFEMNQASDTGVLTLDTGEKTDVCLDLWSDNIEVVYNTSTKISTLSFPVHAITGNTIALINTSDGSLLYPSVTNNSCTIAGDLRGQTLVAGFIYNLQIDLPKLFVYKQESGGSVSLDNTSNLIIHRLKVSTGLSGPVDYKVSITGTPDWDNTVSVTLPYQYDFNAVNMLPAATHTLPVYQRNSNLLVRIEGSTPFPISLLGFSWEGRYTDKFYSRV